MNTRTYTGPGTYADTIDGHTFVSREIGSHNGTRRRTIRKINGKVVSIDDWIRFRRFCRRQEEGRSTGHQLEAC